MFYGESIGGLTKNVHVKKLEQKSKTGESLVTVLLGCLMVIVQLTRFASLEFYKH